MGVPGLTAYSGLSLVKNKKRGILAVSAASGGVGLYVI